MSLVVPWLVFPLVLGLLSLGCGLLVEQAAGIRIMRPLLLPVGFSVIVVAALVTTTNETTAGLTTPLLIALAVAGLTLSLPWRPRKVDGWSVLAAFGAFAAFGAPVILSGEATFAGYITLDDTASWLGVTDRLLEHGRNLDGLAPSTYEAVLDYYWVQYGYPVGTFPPLGVGHDVVRVDSAWLIQPYHAFLAAMLALSLYALVARLIESQAVRALAAVVACQPALLYAYSLWGGVKEMATAAVVALVAALTPTALREAESARAILPLAVASAALIGILNLSSGAWLGPLLFSLLVLGIWLRGRSFVRLVPAFAVVVVALSIPSLLIAGTFVKDVELNAEGGDIGNLIGPLSTLQVFGIWPVGDFRLRPGDIEATYVLIGVLAAAGVVGLASAWRRRVWEVLLYVGGAIAGCAIAVLIGSAWIDAKALAIASPALVLAGMSGAALLSRRGRRVEAAVVAAAIAGGVLWSNALAYHDVWLAPRGDLRELEQIGKRFEGEGPTLVTEYQIYGTRHFLRHMDPEGAGELRRRRVPLRNGGVVEKGSFADIDEFQLDGVLVYRTLVVPRSPVASRPPSLYRLVWEGDFYEVWQRPGDSNRGILEHLSLGDELAPAAIPRCSDVLRLAQLAESSGGRLAAVRRTSPTVVRLGRAAHPVGWQTYADANVVYPAHSGVLQAQVRVPVDSRYGVWVGGSFRRRLEVLVDGRRVGIRRHQLSHPGVYTRFDPVDLRAGTHTLTLRYTRSNFSPGSGGSPFPLGPVVLSRTTAKLPVTYIAPEDAQLLCDGSFDWVEALAMD
jgi:hypothetical protein